MKKARDKAMETWLLQEVATAYDAMRADPSRGRSTADVRASLAAAHKRATVAGYGARSENARRARPQ